MLYQWFQHSGKSWFVTPCTVEVNNNQLLRHYTQQANRISDLIQGVARALFHT